MTTMVYSGRLIQVSCYCSIELAVPDDLYRHALRSGASIYCPLGHSFGYDSENERLKRDLKSVRDSLAALVLTARRLASARRRAISRDSSSARSRVSARCAASI